MTEIGPAPEWNPPSPDQMPWLRMSLVAQMDHPYERTALSLMLSEGRGTVNPDRSDPDHAAALLLSDERRRLKDAPLYLVSDEMTSVAQQAGAKLPTWHVQREDMPSASGFVLFGAPIATYVNDTFGRKIMVPIVGASWGPTRLGDPDQVWVTFWSVTNVAEGVRSAMEMGLSRKSAEEFQRTNQAELSWDNEVLMTIGSQNVVIADGEGPVDPAAHTATETSLGWAQTLRATWLLMRRDTKRPIAEIEEHTLRRTLRRRAEREGVNPAPVQVVHLHARHRPPRTETEHASGYTVKVRSHVTGHVRWQPYRSLGVIKPIWIEPHVRGPADAPFKATRERVNVLDRPPGGRPPQDGK